MEKIDFKKADKAFYTAKRGQIDLVDVPCWRFLAIDGEGNPNSSVGFQNAVTALYSLSFTLKFRSKMIHDRDYVVGPLEGLWWADDMEIFLRGEKERWKWRLLIRQPGWQTDDDLARVREGVIEKAEKAGEEKLDIASLQAVHAMDFEEGLSVQVLHVGSYADEGPLITKLHNEFMPDNGLTFNGEHHEVYLSDARRVAPEKLKTIIRQPVKQLA